MLGFSWSLYFCQRMVEAALLDARLPDCAQVLDRHIAPRLGASNLASAVYVDGAAIVGLDREKVLEAALQ